jgi:hypothetical protein
MSRFAMVATDYTKEDSSRSFAIKIKKKLDLTAYTLAGS